MAAFLTLSPPKKAERVGKGIKISKTKSTDSKTSSLDRTSLSSSDDAADDDEIEIISGKKALKSRKKAAKLAKKMEELSAVDDCVMERAKKMNLKSFCRGDAVQVGGFDMIHKVSEMRDEIIRDGSL